MRWASLHILPLTLYRQSSLNPTHLTIPFLSGTLGFADELVALIACPAWGVISDRLGVRIVSDSLSLNPQTSMKHGSLEKSSRAGCISASEHVGEKL